MLSLAADRVVIGRSASVRSVLPSSTRTRDVDRFLFRAGMRFSRPGGRRSRCLRDGEGSGSPFLREGSAGCRTIRGWLWEGGRIEPECRARDGRKRFAALIDDDRGRTDSAKARQPRSGACEADGCVLDVASVLREAKQDAAVGGAIARRPVRVRSEERDNSAEILLRLRRQYRREGVEVNVV